MWRYVYKYKSSEHSTDVVFEPIYNCRKAFSDAEETMLKDYFTKASKIHHGVSAESARELAYQFAIKVNKSFPFHLEKKKSAGKDWLSGFLKRFPELSLQKPEATSLARATLFNKTNVSSFFDKLEECLKRAPYSPSDIYYIMLIKCQLWKNHNHFGISTQSLGKKCQSDCVTSTNFSFLNFGEFLKFMFRW